MSAIGTSRAQAEAIISRFGLVPFRTRLTPADFEAAAQAGGCAPQRRRAFTPEVVVWCMVLTALGCTSLNGGLAKAWALVRTVCTWVKGAGVTEEAFCQARHGLTLRFWRALWRCVGDKYEAQAGRQILWKGYLRLLAVDGTELNLPNTRAVAEYFTRPRTQRGVSRSPQGRLVAVCSVLTGFCFDFEFISRRYSEHLALRHLIRRTRENDLLLLDRGFFSYAAIQGLAQRRAHFLMRVSSNTAQNARLLRTLGPDDTLVQFVPSARTRREQPGLPAVLSGRLIRYQLPGFRPSWLLTSLTDPAAFPKDELIALYHYRWRIEVIYREWKHTLNLQNLRTHTPSSLRKEIHAHLLLNNLVRWVMTDATRETDRTPLHFSFTAAVNRIADAIPRMAPLPRSQLAAAYAELLAEVRAAPILQRPNRSYPRDADGIAKNKGHGIYRLPARLRA